MMIPGGGHEDLERLLVALGTEPLLREAEVFGLSPKGRRLRCPFEGCRDKGANRERDATVTGAHPRIFCHACNGKGDLVDLLQLSRGLSKAEAIAHLKGTPAPARPRPELRVVPTEDPDKLTPAEVKKAWDALAHEDELGQRYLEDVRGLGDAVEQGLVRFATEQHPDKEISRKARNGYRVAVLLTDVVGNPRGIQLRLVREPRAKEPKILSLKGSSTKTAFFGAPDHVEAEAVIAVAEGLADTLAVSLWAGASPGIAVVGAAGKSALPSLADELQAAGIPLEGKVFALFPQNDRPKNHSRREFVRLGQKLTALGAHVAIVSLDEQVKDVAEALKARPDLEWPPPELAKAIRPEPGDDVPRDDVGVTPDGCAVPVPSQVRTDFHAKDFTTLVSLLDDPVYREPIMGAGELSWCEMTWRVRFAGRELAETDFSAIRLGLEGVTRGSSDNKPISFREDDIARALSMLARRKPVHPVRDWLRGLKWDGWQRIDTELPQLFGHQPDSFAARLLRRWLISAVARGMRPGCKVDTVLVLVGEQSSFKSTFFDVMGGAWFTDSPVQAGADKDGKLVMRRSWIIEWGELDAMRRARDQETIKAFLSQRVDVFRKPYGRDVAEAPRHCVIVGTTNHKEFLFDPTGSRRFWPVEVLRKIDIGWVRAHREQLWAEAVQLFNAGEQWWLTAEEDLDREAVALEHQAEDVWTDPVKDWLGFQSSVSIAQVLVEAIGRPLEQHTRADEMRIGAILRGMGWTQQRRREAGTVRRVYVRPT